MKNILALLTLILFLVACTPQKLVQQAVAPSTPHPVVQSLPEQAPPTTQTIPEPQPTVQSPPATRIEQTAFEADDNGFYPTGDITVKKGDNVKLTFTIRTNNVYYGGLEIKSDDDTTFDTGTIKPGQSSTVQFIGDKTFTYSSWWPSLAKKKQTATVTIT